MLIRIISRHWACRCLQAEIFQKILSTDSTAVIINETAAKLLGFKNPLNETLYRPSDYASNGMIKRQRTFHIIGVVKDFNFNSMHDKVGPLIIELNENWGRIAMRINTKNIPALISAVEEQMEQYESRVSHSPIHF